MPRAVNSAAIWRADMPALFNSARTGASCIHAEGEMCFSFMGKSRLDSPAPAGIYLPMLLRRVAFSDLCERWPPARQATYLDFTGRAPHAPECLGACVVCGHLHLQLQFNYACATH